MWSKYRELQYSDIEGRLKHDSRIHMGYARYLGGHCQTYNKKYRRTGSDCLEYQTNQQIRTQKSRKKHKKLL